MTYHSAKGLTFDSVLMPRLVENSFPNTSPAAFEAPALRRNYTGHQMDLSERCGGKASRTVGQPRGFPRIGQRGDSEGFDRHGCRGFHRARRSPADGRRPDLTILSPARRERRKAAAQGIPLVRVEDHLPPATPASCITFLSRHAFAVQNAAFFGPKRYVG